MCFKVCSNIIIFSLGYDIISIECTKFTKVVINKFVSCTNNNKKIILLTLYYTHSVILKIFVFFF